MDSEDSFRPPGILDVYNDFESSNIDNDIEEVTDEIATGTYLITLI